MGEVARIEERRNASVVQEESRRTTFEDFFHAEKDRLLRVMRVITGSRAEAEDITQEAFLRLFERWESVAEMENPEGVAGIVLVDATLPLEWALDPPEIIPEVKIELNANDERIDFYGAGPTTDAVLDSLPHVPITYMFALQQGYPKEWENGAYFAALRRFVRSLPRGKLVKFDTDHFMLDNIPADVADQVQEVVGRSGI